MNWPGHWAIETPDKPAYIMASTGHTTTYRQLNDRSNQLAQLFWEAGLRFGDHIAVLMDNNDRYLEVCWAAQRMGLFFTAINWHFTADEAAYIIDDCDARALIVSDATRQAASQLAPLMPKVEVRLIVTGPHGEALEGYERYEELLDRYPAEPVPDECEGTPMLYSSGTTGRPKGIKYTLNKRPMGEMPANLMLMTALFGFDNDSVYLSPAPLYHSAPLFYCMSTQRLGGTVVVMEHFDAIRSLEYIEKYRVTNSQWVPTMFVRMFKLTEDERSRYDLSSHRAAVHAAAPCPVEVKRKMIDWWGPIIWEYYSSTEGMGATAVSPTEWLERPGTVGRTLLGPIHVCNDDGEPVPTGEVGTVWFAPRGESTTAGFEYHKDPDRTAEAVDPRGWASVGDMGYMDQDGYLFLTDRKTFMIVSGGVNIYPQETENLLITHPSVYDAAVFGIPHAEMGEQVHAVVQPVDMSMAGPELALELVAFCKEHLAHYKCPKVIDFDPDLPRQPTGKLYKRLIRDRYWADRDSRIV